MSIRLTWVVPDLWCSAFPFLSGPREDATRIGSAGVIRRQAVDISPLRRVNQVMKACLSGLSE